MADPEGGAAGRACPRTPLKHMSASCGVYKLFQKSAPPRLSNAGSATAYIAETDFRRQILTSKVDPRTVSVNISNGRRPIT